MFAPLGLRRIRRRRFFLPPFGVASAAWLGSSSPSLLGSPWVLPCDTVRLAQDSVYGALRDLLMDHVRTVSSRPESASPGAMGSGSSPVLVPSFGASAGVGVLPEASAAVSGVFIPSL